MAFEVKDIYIMSPNRVQHVTFLLSLFSDSLYFSFLRLSFHLLFCDLYSY